jgi:hypothetical protein
MDWPLRGPWTAAEASTFLRESVIPLRLSSSGGDDFPAIATQWFLAEEGELLCATQRNSHIASLIRRDPRCAFEISSELLPYRGIRGRATASLDDLRGAAVLDRLIDRYLGQTRRHLATWLKARSDNETAIVIEPIAVSCWDFSHRMGSET